MTRKHFNAIAEELQTIRNDLKSREALDALDRTAKDIANICTETNPRFDKARFLQACGICR